MSPSVLGRLEHTIDELKAPHHADTAVAASSRSEVCSAKFSRCRTHVVYDTGLNSLPSRPLHSGHAFSKFSSSKAFPMAW